MPEKQSAANKAIALCSLSAAMAEKAAALENANQKRAAQVAELAPKAAKALVQHKRINPSEEKKAAEILQDHGKTLELLGKVAAHVNDDELNRLGGPAEKSAAAGNGNGRYDSLNDPNVGARSSRGVKESTVRLYSKLGLTPPASE